MPTRQPEDGKPISRDEAKAIVDNRETIVKGVSSTFLPTLTANAPRSAAAKDELSFFNNSFNGFIFSRSALNDLFKRADATFSKDKPSDHLVVILGGAKDNTGNMMPTVLLSACIKGTNGAGKMTLTTPDNEKPATETPPKVIVPHFDLVITPPTPPKLADNVKAIAPKAKVAKIAKVAAPASQAVIFTIEG